MLTSYWSLIYLGLGLILLELIIGVQTGFDLVLVGLSLVIGGICGWVTGNITVGLIASALLSFAYIIFGRKLVKRKLASSTTHKINTDRLVGEKAIVIKEIKPHQAGQVKLKSEIWRAESEASLKVNDEVEVIGFEGVTLRVR